jgi:hypothetical protein
LICRTAVNAASVSGFTKLNTASFTPEEAASQVGPGRAVTVGA